MAFFATFPYENEKCLCVLVWEQKKLIKFHLQTFMCHHKPLYCKFLFYALSLSQYAVSQMDENNTLEMITVS
jgi:hypothetical protein